MAEALGKFEAEEKQRTAKRQADAETVRDAKRKKRNMKRRKWVDWNTEDDEEAAARRAAFKPEDRRKTKKNAILLGYSGANYFGMQRNPGMSTIEEELFKVFFKRNWIPEKAFNQIQLVQFQRAARTDKGVSALRQVVSLKLEDGLNIQDINADLPPEIRLFGIVRVTKGFNCKENCDARTYTYTMPTIALSNKDAETTDMENFRVDESKLKILTDVLKHYEGTCNFHNFTSKKNFHDPSAKRFITSFTHDEPFLSPQGVEFITLKVKGQSFMLHQIRKMVAVALAIVRGHATIDLLERAFSAVKIDLPTAPGLGLVLDTVHYERYNAKHGNDGLHQPLDWAHQERDILEFAEKYIYSNIYETECKKRPMIEWLNTKLSMHTYEARRVDEPCDEPLDDKPGGSRDKKKKEEEDDDDE